MLKTDDKENAYKAATMFNRESVTTCCLQRAHYLIRFSLTLVPSYWEFIHRDVAATMEWTKSKRFQDARCTYSSSFEIVHWEWWLSRYAIRHSLAIVIQWKILCPAQRNGKSNQKLY